MTTMIAMQLHNVNQQLQRVELLIPKPSANEILIKISACAICRTDLHIIDGELKDSYFPIIPGHQIVGRVVELGKKVTGFNLNQRVGVPWVGETCGYCEFCLDKKENLCDNAIYTGYQRNGGFAEYCVANANYCFNIPNNYTDTEATPLLCAGLIGYRSFKNIQNSVKKIGIFGFGSAAHIITQVAVFLDKEIYAFTKPNDIEAQKFALKLGATWAGSTNDMAPHLLDAIIIYAPVGELVPKALKSINKGGMVVCAGIHMSDIPSFPYEILWGERSVCSVANLTKQDGIEFLALAEKFTIHTKIHTYPLSQVNIALDDLRNGRFTGTGVIVI